MKTILSSFILLMIFFNQCIYSQFIDAIHDQGNSDATVNVEIVDSTKITGDLYEIHFGEQTFYLNQDGEWIETDNDLSKERLLHKPYDQELSKLIHKSTNYSENNTLDIKFLVEINAPDYNYADGIKIIFPSNIIINDANEVTGSGAGKGVTPIISGTTVFWGDNEQSADGEFNGGEELVVNIDFVEPTFSLDYIIYDDGWSESYAETDSQYFLLGNGTVDGLGTINLSGEIVYQYKTDKYWKLFNKSKNVYVSDYQTILNGYDVNTAEEAPYGYELISDGLKIKVDGSFEMPKTFKRAVLNNDKSVYNRSESYVTLNQYRIGDFSNFNGYENGTSLITKGYGTDNVDKLTQDYEFRFTGEPDSIVLDDSRIIYTTKEGTGSFATFYGARNYEAIDHPLNSDSTSRFLLRIPFEVWNKELGIQVNYQFYDRTQSIPITNDFYVWSPANRMYGEILNTPYTEEVITEEMTTLLSDEFTWNNVWYESFYTTGDVIEIIYNNPIKYTDIYSFQTPLISSINSESIPFEFAIEQNYPNPFNPTTIIKYSLPQKISVSLKIFDVLGNELMTIVNDIQPQGDYKVEFNGSTFASGVYFYRIQAGNFVKIKKMILLR